MHVYIYMHAHSLSIMYVYINIHTCVWRKLCCFIDPPTITDINVTEVCTNDFTVSWIAASNEGLSYNVTLSSPSMMNGMVVDVMMDTSYNFTGLMPGINYNVLIASRFGSCVGHPVTISAPTLTEAAGLPQSELITVNTNVPLKYHTLFEDVY